jgi:hypothetical protein
LRQLLFGSIEKLCSLFKQFLRFLLQWAYLLLFRLGPLDE